MGRKRRAPTPSEEEEWSDALSAGAMDTLIEAQRCVDSTHIVTDIQTGIADAAGLLARQMQPARFMQLVAEQQGDASAPPPPGCGLRRLVRWKHSCSDAVGVVAKAVLQDKVPQLEAAIQQRRERDAKIAENEKKLSATFATFWQEWEGVKARARSKGLPQSDGEEDGPEPFTTDGLGNQLAAQYAAQLAAAAAAEKAVDLSQEAAAVAAEDEQGPAADPGAAAEQQLVPVVTPDAAEAAAAAAGAATTATGTPPGKWVRAQAGQPDNTADAPRSRPGCSWVVIGPSERSLLAQQAAAAAAEAYEEELGRSSRLEAAEAAAAAAREEQQLSADAAAQGGVVLPPEGHKALSNQHLTWKNRMRVTAYMTPDNVEDKVAGVRELLDDSLFRFLDDHQVIPVSYELLECETQKTFLHPEPPPMLTVEALADLTTFEPTPGDIVCGVVRKLSHNSITLLLLGCISVAIERPFIPEDWEYDLHSHCWVPGGDYNKAVSKGDLINCVLLSYPQQDPEQEEVLFNLEGSLLLPHTGLRDWQWPRQQRVRQLLAAQHGQREAYTPGDDAHWQSLHKQLRKAQLTRRKWIPWTGPAQAPSDSSSSGDDSEADLDEQQQDQQDQQQPQQQQQQQGQQSSKDSKQAQKEAAKQAKQAEKARAKAEKKAAKAAEKAARKEARRAEKAAEKAAAKAQKKRAREQQQQQQQQDAPAAAAAAAAAAVEQQPAAKKQKLSKAERPPPAQANGHAADVQQQHSKHKSDKSRETGKQQQQKKKG